MWGCGAQAGYQTDAETGLSLLTNRYYDPAIGRFLTRDPMGYGGGINLYSYTQNNPANFLDPLGTSAFGDWYLGGMGGFSDWVDQNLMNGATANFGQVAGEYDSGCASGWDVAWAGAKFGGNLALNVVPGGEEARAGEVAAEVAVHAAEDGAAKKVIRVIGRQSDTAVASEWEGHSVLNLPPSLWNIEKNDAWIQEGIQNGESFYLASPIKISTLRSGNPAYPLTVYFRELKQLRSAGYSRIGDYMIPGL